MGFQRMRHSAALIVFAAGLMAPPVTMPALAQSVQVLGDYNDWSAFATSGGAKVCFVMSKPQDVRPQPSDYTQSYFYLTHRPGEGVRNELNFVAGYDLAPEQSPVLRIGSESFALFLDGNSAWLDNPATAEDVAGRMRAGSVMAVTVTAADGTEVTESYSLSGVTAASRAMDQECA